MIGLNTRIQRPIDILILTFFLLVSNSNFAHDINVTGVGRVFLDETAPGNYSLSIVDGQDAPANSSASPSAISC